MLFKILTKCNKYKNNPRLRVRPLRRPDLIQACKSSYSLFFFQVNYWPNLQTTSTTDTTSVWRTLSITWPQRTGRRPKTSSTREFSPFYSQSPALSRNQCSVPSARCQNRVTSSASCTPLRSTKATARPTPCTSRARRDTSPGTARREARASPTQRCLWPRTRSSTVDICHQCRDSITITSTLSATHMQTRLVCTARNTPCESLSLELIYIFVNYGNICIFCK